MLGSAFKRPNSFDQTKEAIASPTLAKNNPHFWAKK